MAQPRSRPLLKVVTEQFVEIDDAAAAIADGHITVNGIPVTSAASQVRHDDVVRVAGEARLRGEAKLTAAFERFCIRGDGRAALDVGAAAGGFTRVLLAAGARRVYACDAGHGQLRGALRQDPRVVNLEATNVSALTRDLVPDAIGLVSIDVSYLSLTAAVEQIDALEFEPSADLVGLVKPMFELRRAVAPSEPGDLAAALAAAVSGVAASRWDVVATMDSPVTGSRGAREMLLHARRRG